MRVDKVILTGIIPSFPLLESVVERHALSFSVPTEHFIISCWEDDFFKLQDWIARKPSSILNSVKIIYKSQFLPEPSFGHYIEQLSLLKIALDVCESNDIIVKSRCDLLLLNPNYLREQIEGISLETRSSTPLRGRVLIPSFVPSQPFFFCDQMFIAYVTDLYRGVKGFDFFYSERVEVPVIDPVSHYPSAPVTETKFWGSVFLSDNRVQHELGDLLPLYRNSLPQFSENFDLLKESDLYWYLVGLSLRHIVSDSLVCPIDFLLFKTETKGSIDFFVKSRSHMANQCSHSDFFSSSYQFPPSCISSSTVFDILKVIRIPSLIAGFINHDHSQVRYFPGAVVTD